uniref:Hemopexin n=1 Tax=Gouania willdenowi TaxID=441366 RepID=A0A8C5G6T5_GOUWI
RQLFTVVLYFLVILVNGIPFYSPDIALSPIQTNPADNPDPCDGLEMDAVALNEEGVPYFFKGDYVFKGFGGQAKMINKSFPEVDNHHQMDHIDAAFRMHHDDDPTHNNIFFILDDMVYSYYQYKLEEGYPKNISEVFPGIPDHLDAAVECPKPECDEHSVIFFKGHDSYHFNVKTKAVEKKKFESMPNCTSAFRFMEHYYCFHGHMFSKFDPKTGEVHGKQPKDVRDYFMRCSSEGSNHTERERCSRVHLDAVTSDQAGHMYAFRGHYFLQKDKDGVLKADTIEHAFKELHSDVEAVFSHDDHLYMIKDDNVFAYTVGENHTLLDGYPKPLKEELGIEGHIDAAFVCEDHQHVHIIKGQHIYNVDMKASPRAATGKGKLLLLSKVNAAMCGPEGLKVIVGNNYYRYNSTMLFVAGRALPEQHRVSQELFGCDH